MDSMAYKANRLYQLSKSILVKLAAKIVKFDA